MKLLTGNQVKFAGMLFFLTIAFRFGLSNSLNNESFSTVWIIAASYGILIFITGWIFGKKDQEFLPLYDIGFRFHLITYIICNLTAEIWHFLNLNSKYESLNSVHLTALYWGFGLIIHYVIFLVTRKHSIKGIKKSEIFD